MSFDLLLHQTVYAVAMVVAGLPQMNFIFGLVLLIIVIQYLLCMIGLGSGPVYCVRGCCSKAGPDT